MSGAQAFLTRVVGALERAGIPYMLAGSFASTHHGTPRATQGIDIVIDPTFETLDAFLAALESEDVYFDVDVARGEFRHRGMFNVIDGATSWKLDVIYRKARAFSREELKRRIRTTVLGVEIFVATVEDTILAKLEWAKLGESERQLRDVRGILDVQGEALDAVYIERWLDELGVRELWDRVRVPTA